MRERLGAGEPSRAQTEAARATLPSSSEAIRFYSEGLALLRSYEALAARQVLEKAIAADPDYALAYAALSQAHAALGYELKAQESAARAVKLAQDLPREELLSIRGRYHEAAAEWPKAITAYHALRGMFPDRVDYGVRLANVQTADGHGDQALATIEQLRALPPPAGEDPHIDLAEEEAARLRSEFDLGLEAAERAAAKAESRGAWILVAEAKLRQGWLLRRLGKPGEAADALGTAEELFLDAGDRGKVAEVLFSRAVLFENAGNGARAEELYHRALAVHHQTQSRKGILGPIAGLVGLWRERGELTAAKAKCNEALAAAREVGAQRHEAGILLALAGVVLEQGDPATARQLANDALGISDRIGSRELKGWTYSALAEIALAAGQVGNARVLNRQAVAISEVIGFPRMTAHVRQRQAEVLLAAGELAEAQRQAAGCRRGREELGERGSLAEIDLIRAQIALAAGSRTEAERLAREAASELGQRELFDFQAEATLVVARVLLARGEVAAARDALEPALRRAATSQKPAFRLAVELVHARVLAAAGEHEEALATLERVRAEAQERGLAEPELEARLARGEIEMATGADARGRLEALVAEATEKGFGLIAHRAELAKQGR
jgi:Tfp pilus assembly protein PilF